MGAVRNTSPTCSNVSTPINIEIKIRTFRSSSFIPGYSRTMQTEELKCNYIILTHENKSNHKSELTAS